jgi:hypothetical protein
LRDIGKNGDDFAVLRVKTFIPSEKLYLVEHAMEGLGDGRDFSVDATSNRTVQYAVSNFSNNELYNFNYTGTSHQTRPIKRADTITNKDMYVSYSLDQGLVKLNSYVSSGNPLVPIANIDYNIKFNIDPNKKTYSYEGTTDGFPAYEAYIRGKGGEYIRIFNLSPLSPTGAEYLIDGYGDMKIRGDGYF